MTKTHPNSLIGKRFFRLVVTGKIGKTKHGGAIMECVCDCGKIVQRLSASISRKETKSCGCLKIEKRTTHGCRKTPEYCIWTSMKQRCMNPNEEFYSSYGGRGISVCQRWVDSFESFLADMGKKPPGHSIDRKDNNGNYEPSNCYWATPTQQQNNTRKNMWIEVSGIKRTATQWSRMVGIKACTIRSRIHNGWSHFDAVNIKP